jgi:hypothetical protein
MSDLAELVVRIKADSSALERELKRASSIATREVGAMDKAFRSLKSQLIGLVPALSVAAFVNFARNATIAADRLNDLSDRTGIAATTLSAFDLPLKLAGSSADEFASSITRMNNAIGEAANNSAAAEKFTDIGLSIQDLMAMSPEQQFTAIAKALSDIDNQAEFTNKGMAIFGRQFASMSKFIRQAGDDIDSFVKKQQELGNAFTAEELKMVGEFWDGIDIGVRKAEVAIIRLINAWAKLNRLWGGDAEWDMQNKVRAAVFEDERQKAIREGRPFNEAEFRKKAYEVAGRVTAAKPDVIDISTYGEKPKSGVRSASGGSSSAEKLVKKQAEFNAHLEDYQKATEEADRATEELSNTLKSKLSGSLTDAIFDAENAGDAFLRLGDSIARSIFEKAVAQPFSNGIVDAVGSSGIFSGIGSFLGDLLPSFDVGSYNVPGDMMANIHKGEMIIPAKQADQIRSGGSSGVTVVQNNSFQSGVTRAELQSVLPQVAAAAKNAVFDEIQRGGSASKLVGVR